MLRFRKKGQNIMYLHEIPAILFREYKSPEFDSPQETRFQLEILTITPAKFIHTGRNGKSDFFPFLVLLKGINTKDAVTIEIVMSTSIQEVLLNYSKQERIIGITCGMIRRSEESNTLHDGIHIYPHLDWGKFVSDYPAVAEACFDMARRAMEIYNAPHLYRIEIRPDMEDE